MPRRRLLSPDILNAALAGLEVQKRKIDEQIAQMRTMIPARRIGGIKTVAKPVASIAGHTLSSSHRKKRVLSAEARKRIAAAQKKRWAAFRNASKKVKKSG